jgi:hypothetical protein
VKVTVVVIEPTLTLVMKIEVLAGLMQLKTQLCYRKSLKKFLLNHCTVYIISVSFKEVLSNNAEQSHNNAADIGTEVRSEFVREAKEASRKQPFATVGEIVKSCFFRNGQLL